MSQQQFNTLAKQDMFRALWLAKYNGITLDVAREWVRPLLKAQ